MSVLSPDSLQAQLINMGVIPTLVKLLGVHSHNTALTEMCLIAFGNLAELGEYIISIWGQVLDLFVQDCQKTV